MNAPVHQAEQSALSSYPLAEAVPQTASAALILNGDAMDKLYRFAEMMANGKVTVPKHFQGNPADCLAVSMQAAQWGMNPFAVAQKTHITKGGALGYEAQLISAVVTGSGAVVGDPEYEFMGDWSKILGKVEEKKSEGGGKYYAATYTAKDEEGLGVICRLRLRGETKSREIVVMMSQCYPRFSTQWATDPQQQITYVAIRKWARRFKPGVILGVNATDELEDQEPRFMGTVTDIGTGSTEPPPPPAAPAFYPQEDFDRLLPEWRNAIAKGKAKAESIITKASTKYPLTEEQKAAIRAPIESEKPPAQESGAPVMTYAKVADMLTKAENPDALADAANLIAAVADAGQRGELEALYERRKTELA